MEINNYKTVEIPTKGQGLVANRYLKRGEEILTEEPMFTLAIRTFEYELCMDLSDSYIANCLKELTEEQKKQFKSLTNSMDSKYPNRPNTGRYMTNSLTLQPPWASKKKATKSGIFMETSRVNHSCYPNANWFWNPTTKKGSLFAIKDIPAETEIVRSYFEVASRTMLQRQEMCYQLWQFVCNCPLCSFGPHVTTDADAHFSKVCELEVALSDHARIEAAPQACLADTLAIHKVLLRYCPFTIEFAKILYKAFEITAYHGDRLRASGFLEGVLDTCCYAEGMESPNVRYFQQIHDNLERYRLLGQSDKWTSAKKHRPDLEEGSVEWLEWLWRFGDEYGIDDDEHEWLENERLVQKPIKLTMGEPNDKKKVDLMMEDNGAKTKVDISMQKNVVNKKENLVGDTVLQKMDTFTVEENVAEKRGDLAVDTVLDKMDILTVEESVVRKKEGLAVKNS